MPKACTITKNNQPMLASRFSVEEQDIETVFPIGYILVTDFGNDETFEVLTQTIFDNIYIKAENLQNDFYDINVLEGT